MLSRAFLQNLIIQQFVPSILNGSLPSLSSTSACFMRYLSVTFLLRLRHALGNSLTRIGALSYNSYADKVTDTYTLVSLQDYVSSLMICLLLASRLPLDLWQVLVLCVTGKYTFISLQDYVNQIIGRLPARNTSNKHILNAAQTGCCCLAYTKRAMLR